jgi:outer membrane protein OmpA-like peptidoglycan-associated protein
MVLSRSGCANLIGLAAVALLGVASFGTARAQGPVVSQSGAAVAEDCAGGDAVVRGSGDSINFRDACRSLTVNGSGNSIRVDLLPGGTITLNGSGNTLSYVPPAGAQDVAVTENGQGNTVTRVAGNAPSAAIVTGGLSIHGSDGASVQIGPNGIVATPAPGNGPNAVITPGGIIAGTGVTTGAPPAIATTPGQLMLSGDGQNRDMACNRAKVFINGNNGRFTLRDGCSELYVRGDNNIVHVELAPATQIGISGDNSTVYFRVAPAGPDPALLISGENDRAIRVQHLDDTSGTQIPSGRSNGALPGPAGIMVGSTGGNASVAVLTPQAALAFARGQSITALRQDLGAVRTPEGTAVSLSGDVLFDFDQDRLRTDALQSLAELSVLITRTRPRELRIVGYTDSVGSPQYNLDLSGRRARNVERWLLSEGQVRVAALDVGGQGAADPVASNTLPDGHDNPAGRQQNRRVEVLLRQ